MLACGGRGLPAGGGVSCRRRGGQARREGGAGALPGCDADKRGTAGALPGGGAAWTHGDPGASLRGAPESGTVGNPAPESGRVGKRRTRFPECRYRRSRIPVKEGLEPVVSHQKGGPSVTPSPEMGTVGTDAPRFRRTVTDGPPLRCGLSAPIRSSAWVSCRHSPIPARGYRRSRIPVRASARRPRRSRRGRGMARPLPYLESSSASAAIWAREASSTAPLTVTTVSASSMSFICSTSPRMTLAAIGAQEPASTKATLRFW